MRRALQQDEQGVPSFRIPKPPSALTLGKVFDEYEEWYQKNRRPAGAERALPIVRLFVESVGAERDVREVTREHVQRWVDERSDGRSALTVRSDFARVRAFLRWIAARKGGVDWNVCRAIEKPKDEETTKEAPSTEKIQAVLQKLQGHPWLGDFAAVLAETGMRPSELLGVRGMDLRGKLLSIVPWEGRQLKSKWSRRVIELNATAAKILQERVAKMSDKSLPIFATAAGTVYKERSVYHMLLRALADEKGKVPESIRVTLYDFRHFFCSEHAAPGPQHMEVEALAAYIGHAPGSLRTLLRWYTDQNALRRGAPPPLVAPRQTGGADGPDQPPAGRS
ncbi:MAG TPA: tyrosine-type recombinase/integrase [Planctomycetota bacterium]|nr:tyrosine-type recombinase/integrase [Planctomycetota bacterium]